MTAQGINKFGRIIAFLSFGFGTFLFLTYLIFQSPIIHGILAFLYFIIATLINLVMLSILLINGLANTDHRKNTSLTALLLVINIPIQVLYFMLIIT